MDPNSLEGSDTGRLGDRSPRHRRKSEKEKLDALLAPAAPPTTSLPDHALDTAPEKSKIVVVSKLEGGGRMAVLATPDGPVPLPAGDAAHLLPIGSRVYKTPDGEFEARLPEEYQAALPAAGQYVRAADVIAHINSHIAGVPMP